MSGVELIGGEMTAWSDRRPGEREPAGGAVLEHLLRRAGLLDTAGQRVLVAGPHDDALVDTLAGPGSVTWLLRSREDAEVAGRRGVRTLCGSLAKLNGEYDLVIALDGLDRLCSVEGPQYDWAEALQALREVLRPGGTLVLAVSNELGVHRLVDPLTATSPGVDGDWRPLGEFDETRPAKASRLTARLRAEALGVDWLGASWPEPARPTMLATPEALHDGPAAALSAHAARAFATAYADRPVLSDPRRLAAAAVRNGLAADLAAAWVVITHRTTGPTPDRDEPGRAGGWPLVLLGGDEAVAELVRDGSGWRRRGEDRPLPTGRLLEELLIGACLRHDLGAIRRLLTGWAGWSGTEHFDNVLVDGETFAALEAGRGPAGSAPRRFAETLISGGYTHPWPGAADVDALAAVLSGAAGLSPAASEDAGPSTPAPPVSVRESGEQIRALRVRVADLQERVRLQEEELTATRGRLALFEGTPAYRAARLVRRVLRARGRR